MANDMTFTLSGGKGLASVNMHRRQSSLANVLEYSYRLEQELELVRSQYEELFSAATSNIITRISDVRWKFNQINLRGFAMRLFHRKENSFYLAEAELILWAIPDLNNITDDDRHDHVDLNRVRSNASPHFRTRLRATQSAMLHSAQAAKLDATQSASTSDLEDEIEMLELALSLDESFPIKFLGSKIIPSCEIGIPTIGKVKSIHPDRRQKGFWKLKVLVPSHEWDEKTVTWRLQDILHLVRG